MNRFFFISVVIASALFASCSGEKIDKKSYNILAPDLKAEINKLVIPCDQQGKTLELKGLNQLNFPDIEADNSEIPLYKKLKFILDEEPVDIVINKLTKDGFQFKYSSIIREYSLDASRPDVILDAGTIWMYCDKYKKHNEPKEEPEIQPNVMVTVE